MRPTHDMSSTTDSNRSRRNLQIGERVKRAAVVAALVAAFCLSIVPAAYAVPPESSVAMAGSSNGIVYVGSFTRNGDLGVEYKAWHRFELAGGWYKFSLHKKATFKGRDITWTTAWTTFDSTSGFNYNGVKASSNGKARVSGVQNAWSFRKAHFQYCLGECFNYYPEIKLTIWACKGDSSTWPNNCGDADYRTAG